MPLGEAISESGLLLRENGVLVLSLDGGGRWRLDSPLGAERLLGQRVTVEARRSGYDLLDVLVVTTAAGTELRERGGPWLKVELMLFGALIAAAILAELCR